MGDVAASGGYYISMAADEIVAQPGTITGSIGVLTGKPVLGEALGRAGVTSDRITQGAHAAMFSPAASRSRRDEWALVNDWLDHIYADFTGKVASGRGMTPEQVHEVARGRVWTGADALAHGLVDELGGMDRAAAIARRRAGLPADRAAAGLPARPPDRPAAAAGLQREPRRRGRQPARRQLGSGLAARGAARAVAARAADAARHLGRSSKERRTCSAAGFADALSAWPGAVTLLTIADGRDDIGTTVSAFCPVSADPPLVLVSLLATSYPAEVLGRRDRSR